MKKHARRPGYRARAGGGCATWCARPLARAAPAPMRQLLQRLLAEFATARRERRARVLLLAAARPGDGALRPTGADATRYGPRARSDRRPAARRASPPGTRCFRAARARCRARARRSTIASRGCPTSRRWVSTWSICRRSTRSAAINRKGRNNSLVAAPDDPGSPYAIGAAEGGHDAVHPELGGSTASAAFVAAARAPGMEVALDFAVQCAPDHPWVAQHPEWFEFRARRHDPICRESAEEISGHRQSRILRRRDATALWQALRDVVLFWIEQGVRIFRVDNPHTKPLPFWEWLIRDDPGPPSRRHLPRRGLHPAEDDAARWPSSASRSPTPTSPGATSKAGADRIFHRADARRRRRNISARNFFANTPDILPQIPAAGRAARLPHPRSCWRRRFAGLYGIYSGFELCENRRAAGHRGISRFREIRIQGLGLGPARQHQADCIAPLNRIRRDNPALRGLARTSNSCRATTIACCSTRRMTPDARQLSSSSPSASIPSPRAERDDRRCRWRDWGSASDEDLRASTNC